MGNKQTNKQIETLKHLVKTHFSSPGSTSLQTPLLHTLLSLRVAFSTFSQGKNGAGQGQDTEVSFSYSFNLAHFLWSDVGPSWAPSFRNICFVMEHLLLLWLWCCLCCVLIPFSSPCSFLLSTLSSSLFLAFCL